MPRKRQPSPRRWLARIGIGALAFIFLALWAGLHYLAVQVGADNLRRLDATGAHSIFDIAAAYADPLLLWLAGLMALWFAVDAMADHW